MQQGLDIIIFFIIAIFFIISAVLICAVIIPFSNEIKYIKMEIARSSGNEKKYWEKQLKKLYFGKFIR